MILILSLLKEIIQQKARLGLTTPNPHKIDVYFHNVNSLRSKLNQFLLLSLDTSPYDILLV